MVSVPLVRSNQPMTASNASRHSREPLACHIPRRALTLGSDGHAIKLARAKAAPLQHDLGTGPLINLAAITRIVGSSSLPVQLFYLRRGN